MSVCLSRQVVYIASGMAGVPTDWAQAMMTAKRLVCSCPVFERGARCRLARVDVALHILLSPYARRLADGWRPAGLWSKAGILN
jgi:hypothetical protein